MRRRAYEFVSRVGQPHKWCERCLISRAGGAYACVVHTRVHMCTCMCTYVHDRCAHETLDGTGTRLSGGERRHGGAHPRCRQARMCTCATQTLSRRSSVRGTQRRGPCSLPYVGQQSHTRRYSCVTNACIRPPQVRARAWLAGSLARMRASERAARRTCTYIIHTRRTESAANALTYDSLSS